MERLYIVQKKICLVPSLVVSTNAVVSFVMLVSVVPVNSVDVTGSVDPVTFSSSVVVARELILNLLSGCISQNETFILMTC